jgi:hypothetical protein
MRAAKDAPHRRTSRHYGDGAACGNPRATATDDTPSHAHAGFRDDHLARAGSQSQRRAHVRTLPLRFLWLERAPDILGLSTGDYDPM